MVALACVMACGLFVLIASDMIKYKSLMRFATQLNEERSNVLKKVDDVTSRIWDLASQIESKKTKLKEAQGKEEATLSDMVTVLMERPYTELTISSGVHYIIASMTPSGQPVLGQFLSQKMTISEKFQEDIPKDIAQLILKSAVGEFKQYSLEGKPAREQLPLGGLDRFVLR